MSNILEKGGRKAQIGEIRVYNGVKYIRHEEGWVYIKKNGSHNLETKEGKRVPANQSHIDHYNKHNTNKELESEKKAFNKEVKPQANIKRRIGKELALQHNTKQDAQRLKSLTRHLMKITRDVSKEVVEEVAKKFKDQGIEFTPEERAYYRIGTTYDIMSSLSKYCKDSDQITGYGTQVEKDRVIMSLEIERDGQKYYLENNLIEAGGHNIQQWHTRMLTQTDLPENPKSEQTNLGERLSEELQGSESKNLKDKLHILQTSYDDSKKILSLKREPLRVAGKVEKGEKLQKHLEGVNGKDNKEYLHNLISDYNSNRVLYSNFDDKIKEGLKRVFSVPTGVHFDKTTEIREKLNKLKERKKSNPKLGDDQLGGEFENSLNYFKSIGDDSMVSWMEDQFRVGFSVEYGSTMEESMKKFTDRRLQGFKTFSKSNGDQVEMNKILRGSYLPANLGVFTLPKSSKYDKNTKTLTVDGSKAVKPEDRGVNIVKHLSGEDTNFFRKSLSLLNPITGKKEDFEFKGRIKGRSRELLFQSSKGINLVLKSPKSSLSHKYPEVVLEGKSS